MLRSLFDVLHYTFQGCPNLLTVCSIIYRAPAVLPYRSSVKCHFGGHTARSVGSFPAQSGPYSLRYRNWYFVYSAVPPLSPRMAVAVTVQLESQLESLRVFCLGTSARTGMCSPWLEVAAGTTGSSGSFNRSNRSLSCNTW